VSEPLDEGRLLRLFSRPEVRALFERELARTHPILSNPQLSFAAPGHFYSPLPELRTVEADHRRSFEPPALDLAGIELDTKGQQARLRALSRFYAEFDWPRQPQPDRRYHLENGFFEFGDAVMLFLMLRHARPKRIIEVGSGFSSALMLDTNDRFFGGSLQLTFVEPYPTRLRALLRAGEAESVRLFEEQVQQVPVETFDVLEGNDILFIDSSHVSKVGSDVNHLFFAVLPRLKPGVFVHLHDIFYPFEYPLQWLRQGWSWNEAYLLRAFLQYNSAFEIVMFNNYIARQEAAFVRETLPLMAVNPGGSLWLRRRA
jgi:predicted O-methyltransferase YrrM